LVILITVLLLAAAIGALWYFKGPPDKWLEMVKAWLPRPQEKLVEVPSNPPSPVTKPVEQPAAAEEKQPPPPEPTPPPSEEKPQAPVPTAQPPATTAPPKNIPPAKPPVAPPARPVAKAAEAATAQALKLYQDGNQLVKEKKYAEAVAAYKKALAADAKFILAHRGLGIVYALLGRNQDACKEYRLYYKALPADSKEKPQLEAILKGCR